MKLKLSVSDLPVHYIQQGCLFTLPHLPPHALLSHFKHSLSLTLSHFPTLAGRLSTSDDGYVFRSFNDAGADFFFADAKSVHVSDVIAGIDLPDVVKEFFSYDRAVSYEGHNRPILAVQVTELIDGVFIVCSVNNAVTDGTSLWIFINTFAEMSGVEILTRPAEVLPPPPSPSKPPPLPSPKSVHISDIIAEIHQNLLQITNYISYVKSVSTNYSSSSKSCRSFTDAQTNSNLASSPVSYPMRIAVSPGKVHQVFLNFRGEQLRYNFVSHLSDAFQRHEIKFFIDKYEQRGKDLKHLFFRIEESSIALAIFSTRYPESSWCMDELVKMRKLADQGKLRVIPIFYKVKAEDVRKPTRDSEFGKNFWRLVEASSGDQIKNWKEALECISEKMGLSLGDKSSEADFVKDIVKDVQKVIEAIGLEEEENHDVK